MSASTINRFIELFGNSFRQLQAPVPMKEIERLSAFVHRSMDHGQRRYHRSTHLFELCRGTGPRQTLAALFHDVVYCQLDQGLPLEAKPILEPLFDLTDAPWSLVVPETSDPPAALCTAIFGYTPGEKIALVSGLNEFLSGVVAAHSLAPWVSQTDLVAILACIEATVPFRPRDAEGNGPFVRLAQRLPATAQIKGIELNDQQLREIMTEAVDLANRDVASFSVEDPSLFLSGTWLLIEESNADLSAAGVYTLRDYRTALASMDGFLRGLDPDHVFHSFQGTPSDEEIVALRLAAGRNIAFACEYLGVKILTMAILEAIAMITGGDCTVSMLLGDIYSPDGKPERLEDHLPDALANHTVDLDLLHILEGGRAWESGTDLTTSPVSAFVYRKLGTGRTHTLLADARQMFAGKLDPLKFVRNVGEQTTRPLIRACTRIALSRQDQLLELDRTLGS
ncbi:MAG: hypothetical protein ACI8TX_002523 [Hyphomicrobiaceae bacterium]|jgi:hypothetical protein